MSDDIFEAIDMHKHLAMQRTMLLDACKSAEQFLAKREAELGRLSPEAAAVLSNVRAVIDDVGTEK